MGTLILKAEKRDIFGKKLAKIRSQNKLPAVVYGPKEKNENIFVLLNDFKKVWKEAGENTLIQIEIGGKKKDVLIYEVGMDPIKNEPCHVDFYAADVTKEISAMIPVVFEGVSPAIKDLGGILVKVIHEIEVEALPKDLPHEIKVDISLLQTFEDKVTIGDLKPPAGVKLIGNSEETIVFVQMPKEEEAPAVAEPSLADIEVLTEKKKEDEAAEGGRSDSEESSDSKSGRGKIK